jgi:hypothetical protein
VVQAAGARPSINLLATDLDGTVIGGVNEFPLYTDYRHALSWLRETQGTVWVACTGRSLSSFVEFTMPMLRMDIVPDFVIVRHAYIFSRGRTRWWPHVLWNLHIRYHLWVDKRAAERALAAWHRSIKSCSIGVKTIRLHRGRLGLRFDSPESAVQAVNMLKADFPACRHIQIAVAGSEVNVRLIPFTKGLALSELARYIGVRRENILAIGNGHNDISMLDGSVAAMTGCPSNSEPEVKEAVHEAGGHIADRPSLGGVLQVIEAQRSGNVCSELPAEMAVAPRRDRLAEAGNRKVSPGMTLRIYAILGVIGYIVLLVFANYGMLPFSRQISMPLRIIEKVIEKILM